MDSDEPLDVVKNLRLLAEFETNAFTDAVEETLTRAATELETLRSKLDAGGIEKARLLADFNEAIANTHILHKKLDAQEKAGKMLAEGVADSLKLLRAIQKNLWDRALATQKPGADVVVSIGSSVWRRLCVAVGEPE